MMRLVTVTLFLSLYAAGLSGCYVVPAYTYPAYAPTYPAPPAYVPPSPPVPSPPRQGSPEPAPPPSGASPRQAPGGQGPPPGSVQNCQTVAVEGHYETRVRQNGQRDTVWVPTHERRVCQ